MMRLSFTFNESNLVEFNPVLQPPLAYSPSGEAAFLEKLLSYFGSFAAKK